MAPKVAFLVSEFPLLSETFVVSQMVGLMARGFEVSVICDRIAPFKGIDSQSKPYRTLLAHTQTRWFAQRWLNAIRHHLPKRLQSCFTTIFDVLCDARLNRFDLIVAHFGGNGLRLARSRKMGILRRPFFTIFHGYDVAIPLNRGELSQYRPLFQSGQTLLPVNEFFRTHLITAGASAEHTHILRMGVDCSAIAYQPPHTADELRIVSVCRLVEKKGIEFAIRALGLLKIRRPDLVWKYEIIGDGPLHDELQSLAETCGIAAHTILLGAQPHTVVKQHLQSAHAFLLPSVTAANGDMEGVPVALMEAMAAGLPTISTHHSGIPELIADGTCGLLAPERDAETLSQRLEWLADHAAEAAAMTLAARAKIEADFNQTKLDDQLAERIRTTLSPRQA